METILSSSYLRRDCSNHPVAADKRCVSANMFTPISTASHWASLEAVWRKGAEEELDTTGGVASDMYVAFNVGALHQSF